MNRPRRHRNAHAVSAAGREHVRRFPRAALVAGVMLVSGGCDRILPQRPDTELPPVEDVRAIYAEQGVPGTIEYNGNVVEITVTQPVEQLRRGGSLWARVGPFIYLFSPATRELFESYDGIAAARVITRLPDGEEVARATLARDRLHAITWQRTLNLLGTALRDGTERPIAIQNLVEWGERHTEHSYNPRYAPGWGDGAR
jgi:hypothetical protein